MDMVEFIFIIKVLCLSIWLIIIRGTLPRYRVDQLMLSVWKDWVFVWLLLVIAHTMFIIVMFS